MKTYKNIESEEHSSQLRLSLLTYLPRKTLWASQDTENDNSHDLKEREYFEESSSRHVIATRFIRA